jgi:hypothetical protein
MSLLPEAAITLTSGLPSLPLVVAGALLLFVPGYAVASVLLPPPGYITSERLLAAPALTVALLAALTLWASALHIHLGAGAAVTLLMGSLALVAVQALRGLRTERRSPQVVSPASFTTVAWYLALFGLALGLRLWSTRDILPTLGADSYHHTLIAQLLVERGGLPDSYLPYAPIQTFAYHFGFHSLVAWLHWWTGADVGALIGLAGHLVNAAVALAVAFFVLRVVGDGLVAALAAWLVALLCVFPAYLVNWGRFTQAAGLLLLPVAAALCIDALSHPHDRRAVLRSALAAGLAASGLLLAHYRMAAMLAPLLCTWVLYLLATHLGARASRPPGRPILEAGTARPIARPNLGARASRPPGRPSPSRSTGPDALNPEPMPPPGAATAQPLVNLAAGEPHGLARSASLALPLGAVGILSGLLALPWILHLPGALALGLGQQPGDYGADYYGLERLGSAVAQHTNVPLLALAAVGFALAWVLRRAPAPGKPPASTHSIHAAVPPILPVRAAPVARAGPLAVLLLGVWALAQLALANPRWWPVPMPLAGRVDLVTTIAALCFPLAVAAALALATAWRVALEKQGSGAIVLALALGAGATALGGWQIQVLVTPNNVLVAPADLAAAAWLRAHAPPDTRVAVSAVIFPWAPDYVVGVDGGYWLPLLAGRTTTVLPMLYPGERGADATAVAEMVAITRALHEAPAAPQTAALLRALGVGYVYHSGRSPVPSAAGLATNPALRLDYTEDGVRLWAVAPE